jgi:hypothetical protein
MSLVKLRIDIERELRALADEDSFRTIVGTSECGAVYKNWIGGSIRGSMALNCQDRLTRMRTYTIWLHWLTYMDSTPPLLPRPDIESVLSPA